MKLRLIFFIILLTFNKSSSQVKVALPHIYKSNKYFKIQQHKVNKIDIYYYDSLSQTKENFRSRHIWEYNDKGDIENLYSTIYNSKELYLRSAFSYDIFGRVVSINDYFESGKKKQAYGISYFDSLIRGEINVQHDEYNQSEYGLFDTCGIITRITSKYFGLKKDTFSYQYDNQCRLLSVKSTKPLKGVTIAKYEYLDHQNHIKSEYDENDNLISKSYLIHDRNGNLLQEIKYGKNDKIIKWNSFLYDCEGNEIEKNSYSLTEVISSPKIITSFQNGSIQKRMLYDKNNRPYNESYYYYDEKGMLIKLITKRYIKGEWKIISIMEKEISYFK